MTLSLPLIESMELAAVREERERLLRRLQRVRMDAHSRIRTEQKLHVLTAKQIQIEQRLGAGR